MSKKKIIAISILLALVALAGWYFYKKGSGGKSDLYNRMLDFAKTKIPGGMPTWVLEIAAEKMVSGDVHKDYLIGGKLTDAGALLAAYDSSYFGYGYDYVDGKGKKTSGAEYDLHEGLWKMMHDARRKAILS